MNVGTYIRSWNYDPKTGLILAKREWERSNSLCMAFAQFLMCQWVSQTIRCTDTGNTERTVSAGGVLRLDASNNTTGYGLQIGTGTNATALTDYALQTQVTTNVEYSPCVLHYHYDTDYMRILATRGFINTTGSAIAVAEIAMVGFYATLATNHCIDRSLYSVNLPDKDGLILQWKFEIRKRDY